MIKQQQQKTRYWFYKRGSKRKVSWNSVIDHALLSAYLWGPGGRHLDSHLVLSSLPSLSLTFSCWPYGGLLFWTKRSIPVELEIFLHNPGVVVSGAGAFGRWLGLEETMRMGPMVGWVSSYEERGQSLLSLPHDYSLEEDSQQNRPCRHTHRGLVLRNCEECVCCWAPPWLWYLL